MKTKRTALICAALIAAIAAGCSDKGGTTEPQAPVDESAFAANIESTPTVAMRDANPAPQKPLVLIGKIERNQIEGGCWYFESDKGDRYEPLFADIDPSVVSGAMLYVTGYIDEKMASTCMIGPILRITEYRVVYTPAKAMPHRPGLVSFKGRLGQTKDGCYFIVTPKQNVALDLPICPAPELFGTQVAVTGTWSMLDFVPCGMDRLLEVETIAFIGPAPTPVYR